MDAQAKPGQGPWVFRRPHFPTTASSFVIPAKAGTHGRVDPGPRGDDNEGWSAPVPTLSLPAPHFPTKARR